MITKEQYDKAIAERQIYEAIINAYNKQLIEDFKARWERFDKQGELFTDADLVYAAHERCVKCGAGMAHPKNCGPWHQWTCSNVLKGIGTDKGHTALPFNMFEVKSENQPSANGATTRPQS